MTETKAPAGAPKPAYDAHQFGVRVDAESYELIHAAAARAKLTPSAWIRTIAVDEARRRIEGAAQ